jgi:enterochelin esterase family protein
MLITNGWRESVPGPRIERLRQELREAREREPVLERFWAEVDAVGAPLLAPIADDPEGGVAVTFLWRDSDPATEYVALGGGLVLLNYSAYLLRRIEHTDVFHLTLRLPPDTRTTYELGPNDSLEGAYPLLSEEEARIHAEAQASRRTWTTDPLNPRFFPPAGSGLAQMLPGLRVPLIDLAGDSDAEVVSWVVARPEREFTTHTMTSTSMAMERDYRVYLPEGPVENVVWTFDGELASMYAPLQPLVDGLTRSGRIGPTAIVFIDSEPWMREVEIALNPRFADFVQHELVPEVRGRFAFPSDPAVNVIAGWSGGGTAAAFLALRAPGVFARALLDSPSLTEAPRGHETRELYDWYRHRLPAPTGTRFVLTVGALEVDRIVDQASIWQTVIEFEALLRELGCEVSVRRGSHGHEGFGTRIQTAKALADLLGATPWDLG